MKRKFSLREKILAIILVVVIVLAGWLKLFFLPVQEQLSDAQNSLTQAQDDLSDAQIKLAQMQKMQRELSALEASDNALHSTVPDYDNISNIMVQLGMILSTADNYKLTFSDLAYSGDLVSRPIQITFTAAGYDAAKETLTELYSCPYRCALSNITVSAGNDAAGTKTITANAVSVTVTVTFYEKNKG